MKIPFSRLVPALALAWALAGCSGQQLGAAATSPAVLAQPSALAIAPTVAPAPPSPTSVQALEHPSTTAAPPTAIPAATSTPAPPTLLATAPPTATVVRAATRTPKPVAQPTASSSAQPTHTFPVRSDGNISYGKAHHDYPAADIFCPIGSEFVAVTAGVVDYVSREDLWDPQVNDGATRGGLSVAIIGDDGTRYYGSHLSAVAEGIAPGVRVELGQLLGRTGKSGDAAPTSPHLHFGISHPTAPDDWAVRRGEIAPYRYLQAWQRGEDLTPQVGT